MSVLEIPRILFKGQIAWDPITTNNYPEYYDENDDQPVWPKASENVQAFRKTAINAVVQDGSWNPQGTHRSTFYDTAICGVDLGAGVVTNDPFVAAAVNFRGMLVDLEPYGAFTSQLYFDSMHFGIDGGYRILGKRQTRVTARYINFKRNPANSMIAGVASVVWQTTFAKTDGLLIDPFDSAALRALQSAVAAADVLGIMVRFNTYRTVYFNDMALSNGTPATTEAEQDLTRRLKEGGFHPNPARSVLVGVIGLWRKGEPVHEPGDRALLVPANSKLGSAHARVDAKSLTIDLSNTIPETTRDLQKLDLGTLSVVAVDAKGTSTSLGNLSYAQYDKQAYEAGSGIVSLPLTAAQAKAAADADIRILGADGKPLLAEVALRAIPATPNLYLDEGASGTASFQVYNRGLPAKGPLPVTVYKMSADGGSIDTSTNMETNANGVLSFPVTGTTGGVFAYVPSPVAGADEPTNGLSTQVNTYMYIRTLTADAAVGALPPTWDNVYAHVLANWNAMAPCMDNWLLLNNPVQVKAYGSLLRKLTDPANFEKFLYMPVTRDMTQGERTLLYKFLDVPGDAKLAAAASTVDAVPDFAQLSRSMRRP
jgi:hypothetical protein